METEVYDVWIEVPNEENAKLYELANTGSLNMMKLIISDLVAKGYKVRLSKRINFTLDISVIITDRLIVSE